MPSLLGCCLVNLHFLLDANFTSHLMVGWAKCQNKKATKMHNNEPILLFFLPFSLPFIGHLYRLGRTPVEELHKHRRRFGDVFRLDSGPLPSIFLCNYEQMNKVLKQDATAGRPHHLIPGYVLSS